MRPEALQRVALAAAEAPDAGSVLRAVADGLAGSVGFALARLWLVAPGGPCEACPMRAECPEHTRCLHLAASAGDPRGAARERWSRKDGAFRRFPLGVRKVGRIAASGESLLVPDVARDASWIAHPEWARAEGIRSFAGHALVFRGEVLGVLAVFSREGIGRDEFESLRAFAAQAAVAIANARALEELARLREQLELERDYLREEVRAARSLGSIVGSSPALRRALEQVALVGPTSAGVLLLGESGTGKELFAQAIHEHSARANAPLVRVNCAAVPRELFESEFFGHARGSFTGAVRDRVGRFELADGGTLFLDEVGEIPLELQGKLLRVLQEGTFERVGEERARRVDVRIVAATNRDLRREALAGRFREDLYYRLAVFPIELPPLRHRREDVGPLAAHFLALAAQRLGKPELKLRSGDVRRLERQPWPGNVRELASTIERAAILARGDRLALDAALPAAVAGDPHPRETQREAEGEARAVETEAERRARERANLEAALAAAGGRLYGPRGAATLLGLPPTTLASRLRSHGIRRR